MIRSLSLVILAITVLVLGCNRQDRGADSTEDAYYSGRLCNKKGTVFRTTQDVLATKVGSAVWEVVSPNTNLPSNGISDSDSELPTPEKTTIAIPKNTLIRFTGISVHARPGGASLTVDASFKDAENVSYVLQINSLCDWMPKGFYRRCLGVNPDYLQEVTTDGQVVPPSTIGLDGPVTSAVIYEDTSSRKLVFGGFFRHAGGVRANFIAAWDGETWSNLGEGMDDGVNCLFVHDDGNGAELYAGGHFTTAGGVPASKIAKWNGSRWTHVGEGFPAKANTHVSALTTYESKLQERTFLVAGGLLHDSKDRMHGIAKWDGQVWSPIGKGVDGKVLALATVKTEDSKHLLYAGGPFFRRTTPANSASPPKVCYLGYWDDTDWYPLEIGDSLGPQAILASTSNLEPPIFAGEFFELSEESAEQAVYLCQLDGSEWVELLNSSSAPQYPDRMKRYGSAIAFHNSANNEGETEALIIGFEHFANISDSYTHVLIRDGETWKPLGEPFHQKSGVVSINALISTRLSISQHQLLIAAGNFKNIRETEVNNVALWNGVEWLPVGARAAQDD